MLRVPRLWGHGMQPPATRLPPSTAGSPVGSQPTHRSAPHSLNHAMPDCLPSPPAAKTAPETSPKPPATASTSSAPDSSATPAPAAPQQQQTASIATDGCTALSPHPPTSATKSSES